MKIYVCSPICSSLAGWTPTCSTPISSLCFVFPSVLVLIPQLHVELISYSLQFPHPPSCGFVLGCLDCVCPVGGHLGCFYLVLFQIVCGNSLGHSQAPLLFPFVTSWQLTACVPFRPSANCNTVQLRSKRNTRVREEEHLNGTDVTSLTGSQSGFQKVGQINALCGQDSMLQARSQ